MFYAGLDVHRKFIYGTIVDEKGKTVRQEKTRLKEEELEEFFAGIPKNQLKAVVEACGIWAGIYNYLERRCKEFCVANPLKTKAIASAKIKTDKIDSEILANLLRGNLIPKSYIPPPEIRELRELVRHRQGLVKIRTSLKNRVYAILRKENIHPPNLFNDLFTIRGRMWLRKLGNESINSHMRVLDAVEQEIRDVKEKSKNMPLSKQIGLLKTMPGIGNVAAVVIAGEIGDIKRFGSPRQLCSYAGIVPGIRQSGEKCYQNRITKQGSKLLRWILIQCANIAIRQPCRFQKYFYKLNRKKHRNVAITATARKMLYVIWFMLTNNEPYIDHNHQNR